MAAGVLLLALAALLLTAVRAGATDLTNPSFLVATRDLSDPFFQHSVVLMVPSPEPPLLAGLIINDPGKQKVQEIFPDARQLKGLEGTAFNGGPVEPDVPSMIFRASAAIGSASRIFGDTWIASGREAITSVLKDPRISDLRIVLGRAQWLRDQLDSEIMAGAWYVVPAKPDLVFGDPKDLWSTLVKGGDMQEAQASQGLSRNLPLSWSDGTN